MNIKCRKKLSVELKQCTQRILAESECQQETFKNCLEQHAKLIVFLICILRCKLTNTLKRNRYATLFQWKIHGVMFEVLDRDNEPSSFQEMLTNTTKFCMK